MKSVIFLLLLVCLCIAKERCSTTCATSFLDKERRVCRTVFKKASNVQKCSIRRIKEVCRFLCRPGVLRCWKQCEKTTCWTSRQIVNVCNNKCLVGSKCRAACEWERTKECWTKRLPDRWVQLCATVLEQVPVKHCFSKCVPSPNCFEKCKSVREQKKHEKCWDKVITDPKNVEVCSFKRWRRECRGKCRHRKSCFEECETLPETCTPCTDTHHSLCTKGKRICTWKCVGGRDCVDECVIKAQIDCYTKRIPDRKKTVCADFWDSQKVRNCIRVCSNPEKILPPPPSSTDKIRRKLSSIAEKLQRRLANSRYGRPVIQFTRRLQQNTREVLGTLKKRFSRVRTVHRARKIAKLAKTLFN